MCSTIVADDDAELTDINNQSLLGRIGINISCGGQTDDQEEVLA